MDEADRHRRRQSWFGLKKPVKASLSHPLVHSVLRVASRLSPKLRSGRLPAPRGLAEVHARAGGASFAMLRPDRCEIAKELYWGNGRRPRAADAFALDLLAMWARECDVFLDIGAYTGVFTLATTAANADLRAHAFEIVPAVADLLEANLRRNGVEDRVTVHRVGVGEPGTSMTVPRGEGGSALPSFYSSKMHFDAGVEVPFVALDSLADDVGSSRGMVIKIDVEGTEASIFGHGSAFLEHHRPSILCELLLGQAEPEVVQRVLDPLGYRAYLVGGGRLQRRSAIRPHPSYRDWWFVPEADVPRLATLGIPIAP